MRWFKRRRKEGEVPEFGTWEYEQFVLDKLDERARRDKEAFMDARHLTLHLFAQYGGMCDTAEEKQWLLDQILRANTLNWRMYREWQISNWSEGKKPAGDHSLTGEKYWEDNIMAGNP